MFNSSMSNFFILLLIEKVTVLIDYLFVSFVRAIEVYQVHNLLLFEHVCHKAGENLSELNF